MRQSSQTSQPIRRDERARRSSGRPSAVTTTCELLGEQILGSGLPGPALRCAGYTEEPSTVTLEDRVEMHGDRFAASGRTPAGALASMQAPLYDVRSPPGGSQMDDERAGPLATPVRSAVSSARHWSRSPIQPPRSAATNCARRPCPARASAAVNGAERRRLAARGAAVAGRSDDAADRARRVSLLPGW